MCAGKLLPKRAHKNAVFAIIRHQLPKRAHKMTYCDDMARHVNVRGQSATEAGAQNDMLCRYTPSRLNDTINCHDMARHLNVRRQSGTEAGAQNATFCHITPSTTNGAHKMTYCAVIRLLALVQV